MDKRKAVKYMLSNLTNDNFVNFCHELVHRKGKPQVLRNMVQGKSCSEITDVLLSVFNEKAVEVAAELLNEIECNKEADQLCEYFMV
ncbi:Caspase a [Dissostichus eleginoides]|uniref:Caspase a n=1 Tax=Dissostichus eleginoides TaxID=100907 RepID=A0AAD9C4I5_DISEL|nr:Caspase a [Dissostichus eleginoides]